MLAGAYLSSFVDAVKAVRFGWLLSLDKSSSASSFDQGSSSS